MQLSTLLLGAFALTASALPSPPAARKRDFTYHSTISDPGFYAVSFPPDYHEDQILQWNQLPTSNGSTSALIARFPAGFAVTQTGPAKINVYTRTSGGIGTYLGTVGPLSVDSTGVVAEAVDVVVAELTLAEGYTFEFQIDSEDENASLQFFENDDAGFFLRTGSA
ncbi:hypothetical protein PFICI_10393 [Pestalotiopsis fici W106-1]|uniref:Uncharacterized protein n=1 Tax=Pestalotiopsis fici (strain W106-1 / CGMCC3.15140) TaxID=1229662 RepID=W3WZL9_PESFW|nr:uncharacterized protein PFICI_10393 [Pestalotiopsis fici W106-1]ETS78331.1 hypothetical protein PFICI_10393 [Pestalotiopsis fici W106-1]